jgi:hypothetical protein
LVLVEDDATPYTGVDDGGTAGESLATDDGCTTYTAASADAVTGKIAVIMGTCTQKNIGTKRCYSCNNNYVMLQKTVQ